MQTVLYQDKETLKMLTSLWAAIKVGQTTHSKKWKLKEEEKRDKLIELFFQQMCSKEK